MTQTNDATTQPRAGAANVVVVHPDLETRTRWAETISHCNVWQASDALAANSMAEDQDAQLIIAPWPWAAGLLRKRRRLPARPLLLLGGEIDQTIVLAVAAGVEVVHWADDSGFDNKVRAMVQKSRIRAPRYPVTGVHATWGGESRAFVVNDIALDGFSFSLPLDASIASCMPGARLVDVKLMRGDIVCVTASSATVRYLSAHKGEYRVGCAFDAPQAPRYAPSEISIRQPLRIAGVIQAALKQKRLSIERPDHSVFTDCEGSVEVGRHAMLIAQPSAERLEPLDVLRGSFEFGGELYRFTSVVVSTTPFELKLPTEITVRQRRSSTRHDLHVSLPARVVSRLTGLTHEGVVVKDLSAHGCLLELPRDELYPRGTELSKIELTLPTGSLVFEGVVTHVSRHAEALRVGVEFKNANEEAAIAVAQFLVTHRWPALESGGKATFDELFDLFSRSGLVKAAHLEALAPGMNEVRKTFSRVSNISNTLFRSLVVRERGRVVGHASIVRAYENTWYVQHLAAASGSPDSAISVNLAVSDFFDQIPDLEFSKIAFYPDNSWTGRAFGTFAKRIEAPLHSITRRYMPLLIRVAKTADPEPLPKGIEGFEAQRADFKQLEHYFIQRTPSLAMRANDLLAEKFDLAHIDEDFSKYGLGRRRRAWVIRDSTGILAVATAEVTSPGLSLFDWLNAIRITYGHANPSLSKQQIIRWVISTVIPFFAERGAPAVRLFIDPEEFADFEELGFAQARVATEWICHRSANRQLSEHVYGLGEALRERNKRLAPLIAEADRLIVEEPQGHDFSVSSVNLPIPSIRKKGSGA